MTKIVRCAQAFLSLEIVLVLIISIVALLLLVLIFLALRKLIWLAAFLICLLVYHSRASAHRALILKRLPLWSGLIVFSARPISVLAFCKLIARLLITTIIIICSGV